MNSIIDKIGTYQILTNLFPGVFFSIGMKYMFGIDIFSNDIGYYVAECYFMGLIISRIGSILVVPICKKLKLIKHVNYSEYIIAAKGDPKIDVLSEMNNYLRSLLTCTIFMPVCYGIYCLYISLAWFHSVFPWGAIIFLVVLFATSYRKNTAFIIERIHSKVQRE